MTRALAIAQAALDAADGDALTAVYALAVMLDDRDARHAASVSPGFLRAGAREVWRAGRVAAVDVPEAL